MHISNVIPSMMSGKVNRRKKNIHKVNSPNLTRPFAKKKNHRPFLAIRLYGVARDDREKKQLVAKNHRTKLRHHRINSCKNHLTPRTRCILQHMLACGI